ncbi:MAG TPA: FAD-dependent monooxygenase [Polyangiaceae bacterium]|nr:FAD-dependent monooxygenase [Polyangiaceae bacterium]
MYEHDVQVLVAGAGPTGLTLAIELARRSVRARLVDVAAEPFVGSRGKGLQPRTLEVFHAIGVIDELIAAGALYPRLRFHVGPLSLRGGSIGSAQAASEAVPYPNLWLVPQARTEQILRARLAALGGRVEFGVGVTGVTAGEAEVQVELSSGERVRASYLVGCDGGHSTVRQALGLSLVGRTLDDKPQRVADVEVEGLDRRDWHIWPLARGGPLGLCPLPGTSQFQLSGSESLHQRGIERAVQETTGHRVSALAWQSVYRPQVRRVERFRRGRVFLAGDAAHVHPPAGGQGLNTGVQDAYNLGWKLAHALAGGPPELLDSYERERLPVAAAVLGLSKTLYQTRSLRRGDATNQLALHYRDSALSSGDGSGSLRPGDRMPDRRLGDGSRLFDRFRDPAATLLVEPNGTRILVRPDGYVASIGKVDVSRYAGAAVNVVHG